ncbi:MAG: molybdenum cofactor guanylyltransferase [Verrucomicrobiia bacterium]|jgi:molybdopterin-guanine dinucleotide biosynthesis protein A
MEIEACILAGGKSARMGFDKAGALLRGRTLLQFTEAAVGACNLSNRLIREDHVESCGPLSGILTAFLSGDAKRILFLSCDMPFVQPATLRRMMEDSKRACFASDGERFGFPFCLSRENSAIVEEQIGVKEFSLQRLARRLNAKPILAVVENEFLNVNTPEELERAGEILDAPLPEPLAS